MASTDIENVDMYCFQCEQTARGEACTTRGVCTKDASVAALQDHLMWGLQSVAVVAESALRAGVALPDNLHNFVAQAIFSTLTNVNFSPEEIAQYILECETLRDTIRASSPSYWLPPVASWVPAKTIDQMVTQGKTYSIPHRFALLGKDRACLQELLMYGVKGVEAYYYHALLLGEKNDEIGEFALKALASIHQMDPTVEDLLGLCLECGKVNFAAMELLDKAHTTRYGHPEITKVLWAKTPQSGKAGKAILISGHDLLALEQLLELTKGCNINVYTHGEMLPCNAYPLFKSKYPHLVGHYGTAWQNQRKEFEAFPGPIFMTTNCYVPAPPSYLDRVFAASPVGGIGVKKIGNFDAIIACARSMPGFPNPSENLSYLTIGFAHNTVLSVADQVIAAVKSGALRRIFLIGGCDGMEKERNYFTEFAAQVPSDCLILTLACGKFKINGGQYGTLGGLPRLLDMGQCNDAYSAIKVAVALAGAFNTDVNSLPLSLVISWFEQKAVAILLTLLYLGIQNIHIGPKVPGFFTPTILNVLVEKFHLHVTGDPATDLRSMLGH
ncbi:hydroxylamine reductase [Pelomyxa schiedti]|nr:hydroxylamine reductase [Pelomyxa schiedti]